MAGKHGGYRPGSGRKPIAEELNTRQLAQAAIIKKFGSIDKGLVWLLETNEPTLVRFAFEHAIGKPVERVAQTDSQGNDKKDDVIDYGKLSAAALKEILNAKK